MAKTTYKDTKREKQNPVERLACPMCGWIRPMSYGKSQRTGEAREVRFDKMDVEHAPMWRLERLIGKGRGSREATKNIGKYSAWHNKFSKDVILFYGLKGYRFFADSLKGEPELLVSMVIKAHAIELGPTFKKPRVIPVDPLRINIFNVPAFQRADDLFSHPEKYIKKDKEGNIVIEKSGWCPDEGEFSSPIFLWEVLTAYEANLFSHAYFIKAQELVKKINEGESK